jgi:GTP-binding protein
VRFTSEQIDAGRRLFGGPSCFLLGVTSLDRLPEVANVEIAFAGRSNVGKSSLINALTGVKDLARASNTPGRTRELNYFDISGRLILVDLPGYGYAKAAKAEIRHWQNLLRSYLGGRPGLTRVFVLIDARHGALPADHDMLDLLDTCAVAYQLVLTKADKLKPDEIAKRAEQTAELATRRAAALPAIHVTSAEKGAGIAELRAEIAGLL